jgi:hypothetical protein
MSVNARLEGGALLRDMPWCDDETCQVCGEKYTAWTAGISFDAGVALVRQSNGAAGGYRSRGPVLWAMRCLKLDAWAMRHLTCGACWEADHAGGEGYAPAEDAEAPASCSSLDCWGVGE